MPHQVLIIRISGEPTYQDMKRWKREMSASLRIALRMPEDWGRRGRDLLGKLQDTAVFTAHYGAAYNPPPAASPTYPIILPGATPAQREQARAKHTIDVRYWATAQPGNKRNAVTIVGAAALERSPTLNLTTLVTFTTTSWTVLPPSPNSKSVPT